MPSPTPGDEVVRELLQRYPVPVNQSSPSKMYHVLMELHRALTDDVPGHVVELGCFDGGTTVMLRRLLDMLGQEREIHIYDSWQGVPAPVDYDRPAPGVQPFEKGFCSTQRRVFEDNFAASGLRMPIVHSGWFADIPDEDYPSPIAFALFDGDLYSSIVDSFTKVYGKLSRGARVVIDDYEWERLPGVKKACADFLCDKPERESMLPDYFGQGLGGGAVLVKR